MKVDLAGDWDVEADDFGGRIVRHRHWDDMVPAYVYSSADQLWAECAMCGASLGLGDLNRLEPGATIP